MNVALRHYRRGDHDALATIFTRAVHELTAADYSPAQRAAWAQDPPDVERWRIRCELKRPFVATVDGVIAGFLELDPDGHIDCTYVSPDFARRGVMTTLMAHAEGVCRSSGLPRMFADVSVTARPFFAAQGFVYVRSNEVHRQGVVLVNHLMEKRL